MYRNILKSINENLKLHYGAPQHSKSGLKPIDYLVFGILSQNTSTGNAEKAFSSFKKAFPNYKKAADAPVGEIEKAIKAGGLYRKKARLIKNLLGQIWDQRHCFDLNFLAEMEPEEAKIYLASFKGIGVKTACYTLLFSFGAPLMPVDTHVLRITRRLGIVDPVTEADETHKLYQQFLDAKDFYQMHLNLVEHGRKVCKARQALCHKCFIRNKCKHAIFTKFSKTA